MVIFWRLMLGHLLADFTFQTNFINHWKRTSLWGMIAHCATHPICYLVLTWPFLDDVWVDLPYFPLRGWLCVVIVFVAHFMEDQWRVFSIFKNKTPDNTMYFIWDQLIHYAVIFAVIPEGLRGAMTMGMIPEAWPVLGCLFVLVTHAATVIVYFIEKDFYGRPFPGNEEKYIMMLERLVLALCFLVPGNAWPLLSMAWAGMMYRVRSARMLDLSWPSLTIGGSLAVLCGLAARFVYYYR